MDGVYERTATHSIERSADSPSGVFDSVLATSGEASDGHVLSIEGLVIEERMPLLFGHRSEAMVPVLGSITSPRKTTENGIEILRTTNTINTDGEGPMADIRRGMAQLVDDGDLRAMSVRWAGRKAIPRTALSKDHSAFIDADTSFDDPRRFGMFFEKSDALEGSVVAIGADPKALIGRSDSARSDGATVFFRYLARLVEEDVTGIGNVGTAFQAVENAIGGLREIGCDDSDVVNAVSGYLSNTDLVPYTFQDGEVGRTIHLPRSAWNALLGESRDAYKAAWAVASGGAPPTSSVSEEREPTGNGSIETPAETPATNERVVARPGTVAAMGQQELADTLKRAVREASKAAIDKAFGRVA